MAKLTGLKAGAVGLGLNADAFTFNLDEPTDVGLAGVVVVVPFAAASPPALRLLGSNGGILAMVMAIGARLLRGAFPVGGVALPATPGPEPVVAVVTGVGFADLPLNGGMA